MFVERIKLTEGGRGWETKPTLNESFCGKTSLCPNFSRKLWCTCCSVEIHRFTSSLGGLGGCSLKFMLCKIITPEFKVKLKINKQQSPFNVMKMSITSIAMKN